MISFIEFNLLFPSSRNKCGLDLAFLFDDYKLVWIEFPGLIAHLGVVLNELLLLPLAHFLFNH